MPCFLAQGHLPFFKMKFQSTTCYLNKVIASLVKYTMDQLGFKTDRKLLVICSDDWGSMRLRDVQAREALKSFGLNLDSNRFDRYDCLETSEDLEMLYDVLASFKDVNGNSPVFTALTNVANPDFEKIRNADYQTYFYKDISETYQIYPGRDKVMQLFHEGIQRKIFVPQFHGREHLQVNAWMNALAAGDTKTRAAFNHDFFFLAKEDVHVRNIAGEFAEAFNFWNESELAIHSEAIYSGTSIFKKLFHYPARFFTAPVLIYHDQLNKVLSECGISVLDVPRFRSLPIGENRFRKRLSYLGQRNNFAQTYINRNAVFETNLIGSGVESCLSQIASAFNCRKPAIISNHRASFVGGINKNNRADGLRQLDSLLKAVIKRWPTVEFLDMVDLERLMESKR